MASGLTDRRRYEPTDAYRETVGQRLRGKYERAVRAAARDLCARTSTRGDRDRLVRLLTEERLLIPHEDAKRPMRRIAHDTRSSYARVAQTDRQLAESVRDALQSDPEFVELERRSHREPLGPDVPIDGVLERDLARASTEELVRRFLRSSAAVRARVLEMLLKVSHDDIQDIIRPRFRRLDPRTREGFLQRLKATT
jgi:hypothetical protein